MVKTTSETKSLGNSVAVWEHAMTHVKADGPVSEWSLAAYLMKQVPGVTQKNCDAVTAVFVDKALKRGEITTEKDGGIWYIDVPRPQAK